VRSSPFTALWGSGGGRLFAGDLAVLVVFIALSFFFFALGGSRGAATSIEVEVSGRSVLTVDRDDTGVREVKGRLGVTRIEIRGRQVRVLSSPCPLKLCQRAGWIGTAGEMVVCLPNEVVVRLPGSLPGSTDAVSR
jgi:hypothetical protein